jgi:prepilin-type N-terminal cleavage/methylation domain-containing protein
MNRSAASADAGFSLVEILVALVLLTVGVAAVTTGFTEGQRIADEVSRRQRAISLAQDKLAEKLAMRFDAIITPTRPHERVEAGTLMGQDERNGVSRTWFVEPDHPAPGLARVWVATSWTRRGTVQTYQIAGLLAQGGTP